MGREFVENSGTMFPSCAITVAFCYSISDERTSERTNVFHPIEKKRFEEVRETFERAASRRSYLTASPCSRHGLLTESGSLHCFTTESPEHNSAPLYSRSRSFSFFFLFSGRFFSPRGERERNGERKRASPPLHAPRPDPSPRLARRPLAASCSLEKFSRFVDGLSEPRDAP